MNYKGKLMAVALIILPMTAHTQPEITTQGAGGTLAIAEKNSWIAAHFACGRKGFWADLDSIQKVQTDRSSYTIAGGRKKITQYHTTVTATCQSDYQRYPSDRQPTD
jgi:hypothetical protein